MIEGKKAKAHFLVQVRARRLCQILLGLPGMSLSIGLNLSGGMYRIYTMDDNNVNHSPLDD
jgi:hypothetical protein